MRTRTQVAIGIVLVLGSAATLVFGGRRILDQRRTSQEITRLRDELYPARVTAERCQRSIAAGEGALQAFDARLDSLRTEVESFEALDRRGVPIESYEEYLGRFDSYSDSVNVWEAQERQLRAADAACRGVIRQHNELSDSLQRVLEAAGIEVR